MMRSIFIYMWTYFMTILSTQTIIIFIVVIIQKTYVLQYPSNLSILSASLFAASTAL